MKTYKGNSVIKQMSWSMPLSIIVSLIIISAGPRAVNLMDTNEQVIQAYELRMNGKIEESKSMLESVMEAEPTNASAYFEMARLVKSTDIMNVDQILEYCDKAIENDSNNVAYYFFRA